MSLKSVLNDLVTELDGSVLSETFDVNGRKWALKLLNEEETNWRNAHVIMANTLSAMSSFKLPTLAMSIQRVENSGSMVSIREIFQEEWDDLPKEDRERYEGLNNAYSQKYFAAEKFMEFLSQRFPDALDPLYEKYEFLRKRRDEAQAALKKSSGEGSQGTTDPSPPGEK